MQRRSLAALITAIPAALGIKISPAEATSSQANCMGIPHATTLEQANRERDGWIESAAMFHRNETYYRGLLEQIAETIGVAAYTADDGSVYDTPLCIKLPELVKARLSAAST